MKRDVVLYADLLLKREKLFNEALYEANPYGHSRRISAIRDVNALYELNQVCAIIEKLRNELFYNES